MLEVLVGHGKIQLEKSKCEEQASDGVNVM